MLWRSTSMTLNTLGLHQRRTFKIAKEIVIEVLWIKVQLFWLDQEVQHRRKQGHHQVSLILSISWYLKLMKDISQHEVDLWKERCMGSSQIICCRARKSQINMVQNKNWVERKIQEWMGPVIQLKQLMVILLPKEKLKHLSTTASTETNQDQEKLQALIHEIGMDNPWDTVSRRELLIIMNLIGIMLVIDTIQVKRIWLNKFKDSQVSMLLHLLLSRDHLLDISWVLSNNQDQIAQVIFRSRMATIIKIQLEALFRFNHNQIKETVQQMTITNKDQWQLNRRLWTRINIIQMLNQINTKIIPRFWLKEIIIIARRTKVIKAIIDQRKMIRKLKFKKHRQHKLLWTNNHKFNMTDLL